MIAVRRAPAIARPLTVMVTLDADGHGEVIADAADSDEFREVIHRLRAWCAGAAVDALLAELDEGGDQR